MFKHILIIRIGKCLYSRYSNFHEHFHHHAPHTKLNKVPKVTHSSAAKAWQDMRKSIGLNTRVGGGGISDMNHPGCLLALKNFI